MISPEDASNTYEYDEYFKIMPGWAITQGHKTLEIECESSAPKPCRRVAEGFSYSSNLNDWWLSAEDLRHALKGKETERLGQDARIPSDVVLT
jgi:hypothetical protein